MLIGGFVDSQGPGRGRPTVNNGWVNVSENSSTNLLLLTIYCWKTQSHIYFEFPKLPGPGRQGHWRISLPSGNSYLAEEYMSWIIPNKFHSFNVLGTWWKGCLPCAWHNLWYELVWLGYSVIAKEKPRCGSVELGGDIMAWVRSALSLEQKLLQKHCYRQ